MRVDFIGPGHIGRGMARGLLASGFPTTVHDVIPAGSAELSAAGADADVADAREWVKGGPRTTQALIGGRLGLEGPLPPEMMKAFKGTAAVAERDLDYATRSRS